MYNTTRSIIYRFFSVYYIYILVDSSLYFFFSPFTTLLDTTRVCPYTWYNGYERFIELMLSLFYIYIPYPLIHPQDQIYNNMDYNMYYNIYYTYIIL